MQYTQDSKHFETETEVLKWIVSKDKVFFFFLYQLGMT